MSAKITCYECDCTQAVDPEEIARLLGWQQPNPKHDAVLQAVRAFILTDPFDLEDNKGIQSVLAASVSPRPCELFFTFGKPWKLSKRHQEQQPAPTVMVWDRELPESTRMVSNSSLTVLLAIPSR